MSESQLALYQFNSINGWSLMSTALVDGVQKVTEFELLGNYYLLVVSKNETHVVSVFQQSNFI